MTSKLFEQADNPVPLVLQRGRHGLDRKTVMASQRLRLLSAMTELVAERGYSNIAVADVIERAGTSRKTFYEHFDNKQQCLVEAFSVGVDRLNELVMESYDVSDSWRDALQACVAALLGNLAETPAFARMYAVGIWGIGEDAIAPHDNGVDKVMFYLRELHKRARAEVPSLPEVDERAYRGMGGAIEQLVRDTIFREGPEKLPELAPTIVALVWTTFLGWQQPPA